LGEASEFDFFKIFLGFEGFGANSTRQESMTSGVAVFDDFFVEFV